MSGTVATRQHPERRNLPLGRMREAGGWALMCDATAADKAIVRAHTLYAKGPSDDDPPWLDTTRPVNSRAWNAWPARSSDSTNAPPPALNRPSS